MNVPTTLPDSLKNPKRYTALWHCIYWNSFHSILTISLLMIVLVVCRSKNLCRLSSFTQFFPLFPFSDVYVEINISKENDRFKQKLWTSSTQYGMEWNNCKQNDNQMKHFKEPMNFIFRFNYGAKNIRTSLSNLIWFYCNFSEPLFEATRTFHSSPFSNSFYIFSYI